MILPLFPALMLSRSVYDRGAVGGGGETGGDFPLSLGSKLVAYLEGKDLTTIDVTGSNVNAWDDKSANGYSAITTSGQPVLSTDDFGAGKHGVRLTNDALVIDGVSLGGTSLTIGVVLRKGGHSGFTPLIVFVGSGQNSYYDNVPSMGFQTSGGANTYEGYRDNVELSQVLYDPAAHGSSQTARFRMITHWDGSNNTTSVDGVSASAVASTGTFAATGKIIIGAGWDGGAISGFYPDVTFGRIVIGKGLAPSDVADLDASLAAW